MVTMCSSAASAIRITNRAWRVGGGGSAGGSSSVSSRLNVRASAVIVHILHRKPFQLGCTVAMFTGFGFVVRFPMLRQTQQFSRRHLDQREHLAALGDQGVVLRTRNVECAPEPRAFYAI